MRFPAQQWLYRFDAFTLDPGNEDLRTVDGSRIPLRGKSFALLRLMLENAGRLLGRDMIMEALWPNIIVSDDSITQCVIDVRRALGRKSGHLLRTIPRRGYIFEAEVVRQEREPFPQVINSQGYSTSAKPTRRDFQRRTWRVPTEERRSAWQRPRGAEPRFTCIQLDNFGTGHPVLSHARRSSARICGGRSRSAIGQERTLVYTPRIRVGKCRKISQCHFEGACYRIPATAIRRPRHRDVGLGS